MNRLLISALLAGMIAAELHAQNTLDSLAGIDLNSPTFTALQAGAAKAADQARKSRITRQRAVLNEELKKWSEELALREKTRNIKGTAVANAAIDAVRKALAELDQTGTCVPPTSSRRELDTAMTELGARLAAATRVADPALDTAFMNFKRLVTEAGAKDVADVALRAKFDQWVAAPPPATKPVVPTPSPTATPGAATTNVPSSTGAAPASDEYFADNGKAQGWKKLGRWTAKISAMDILDVHVFDQEAKSSGTRENPLFGTATPWTQEMAEKLPPGRYLFRLKRIPGHLPVDVEQWPTEKNNGLLEFRTPTPEKSSQAIGFEIEYASTEPLVAVPVETDPAGAQIEVDGRTYSEDGRPVRTPGTLNLPAGPHAIRIFMEGYQDQQADRFDVTKGARISVRLARITAKNAPGRLIRADPRAIWAETGIQVPAGAKVTVVATGAWSCGAKKEMTGPGGYSASDVKFGHYYLNPANSPRQLKNVPYGALIARIGTNEPMALIKEQNEFTAPAAGTLKFDINEDTDSKLRGDNGGALEIRIQTQLPPR